MRIIPLFLLLACFAGCDSDSVPTPAAPKYVPTDIDPDSAEFRYGQWGDRYEDIIYRETKAGNQPIKEHKDTLAYPDKHNAAIIEYYYFNQSILTGAERVTPWRASNKSFSIIIYEQQDHQLTYRYGAPTVKQVNWVSGEVQQEYVQRSDLWGDAIALGLHTYESKWELERETVHLLLAGKDGKIWITEKHIAK